MEAGFKARELYDRRHHDAARLPYPTYCHLLATARTRVCVPCLCMSPLLHHTTRTLHCGTPLHALDPYRAGWVKLAGKG